MEGGNDIRLALFRNFLHGFVKDGKLSSAEDQIPVRGSIIGSFRLPASDVPAEVLDWVLLYLHQRNCPHELAFILAREVQAQIENILPSIVPPITNGGGGDASPDSSDEGQYLLESGMLHGEMLTQLQQVCCQLHNSEMELAQQCAMMREPLYQTSLIAVKNTRRKMEDRHVLIHDLNSLCGLVDGPAQSYYAVFDGHNGVEAANFCSAHLHLNLVQHPKFECDPETAIRDAFAITDSQFLKRSLQEGIKSGCTALTCLIRDKSLYLAWLGDSQAFLIKKGMPETIMVPHKPDRPDEKERVEKEGGCVMFVGTWRVNGILAVSRAFGDFEHKPCVSSEPEIVRLDLDGEEDFLVIACDGLWDTLTPDDVTAAVYHYVNQQPDDIDYIASKLSEQAIERGSSDNITVIVVFLKDLQTLAAHSSVTSFSSESVPNKSNPFDELDGNAPYAKMFDMNSVMLENGDGEYNLGMRIGDPMSTNGPEEIFHPRVGLMPETTLISELPTPPIEDLMGTEAFSAHLDLSQGTMNPFATPGIEAHDHHAKEIASAILSSALESAVLTDPENPSPVVPPYLETSFDSPIGEPILPQDSAFFSGFQEVSARLEAVPEADNIVSASKPWDLRVEHSAQPDVVDYLPAGDNISEVNMLPSTPEMFPNESFDPDTPSYLDKTDESFIKKVEDVSDKLEKINLDDPETPVTSDLVFDEFSAKVAETGQRDELPEEDKLAHLPEEDQVDHSNFFPGQIQVTSEPDLSAEVGDKVSLANEHFQSEPSDYVIQEQELHRTPEVPLVDTAYQFSVEQTTHEQTGFDNIQTNVFHQKMDSDSIPIGNSANPFGDFEAPTSADFSDPTRQPQAYSGFDPFATFSEENPDEGFPFGQDGRDMFLYTEETPSTLRHIQGVPEMIGISEAVPGIQNSEPLMAPETFMTSQKEVLAAFEDILAPGSPEQAPAPTIQELLQPPNNNFFETPDVQTVESHEESVEAVQEQTPALETASENILNLMESVPAPPTEMPKSPTIAEQSQIELVPNNLLVDFLAPQMTGSEVVANLLVSDVPPTPEIVLDKIPDGVPEADGVTEDSDSEKDGGWSYVSGKGKDPSAAGTDVKKAKPKAASTPTLKKAAPAALGKEPPKAAPVAKTATMKPSDTKLKSKAVPSKIKVTTDITATMKKVTPAPIDGSKKPSAAPAARPKPIATAPPKPAGTIKTSAYSRTTTASTTTVTKDGESKVSATKTSTQLHPVSAPVKKVPTPKSTTGTIKNSATSAAPKTFGTGLTTMKPKPAPTAAAPRATSASTLARPTTKPATLTRPTSASTLPKKTTTTSKPSTLAPKVPSTRPTVAAPLPSKVSRPEVKQAKDTVNKQLLKTSGTLRSKVTTTSTTNSPPNRTTTLSKSSAVSKSGIKTLRAGTTSGKTTVKPVAKDQDVNTLKQDEQVKLEPEKGSLEDKGKDSQAVDSGLASPESPVSPQLLMVNGNHSGDAPIQDNTDVREPAELN